MIEALTDKDGQLKPPFQHKLEHLLGLSEDAVRTLSERLEHDYSLPKRHHHTLDKRVAQTISYLDKHYSQLKHPAEATLAALYGYAVYDPTDSADDNRQASAQLAVIDFFDCGLENSGIDIDKVQAYILATADHVAEPDDPDVQLFVDPDMQLFVDADLSFLGQPPEEYAQYAADFRAEYDFLSDSEYAQFRYDYLAGLLQHERLFSTFAAYHSLERRARANMIGERDQLKASLPPQQAQPE